MQNGNINKQKSPVYYLRNEDDPGLLPLVEHLPAPQRMQLEGLVRNEGYSLLRALERVGILIAG